MLRIARVPQRANRGGRRATLASDAPLIEKITIPGLANLTNIMAICASDKVSLGGAYASPGKR